MDEIVKAAIAKWPNVPHCYGWLALDARGQWRMRDERCQTLKLPGDIIRHPALIDFINRNYQCDDQGCWYFQNGPQRVYVELEATPFIVRTSNEGFYLQNGKKLTAIDEAFIDDEGRIFFQSKHLLAMLDDRDLSECLSMIQHNQSEVNEESLMAWINEEETLGTFELFEAKLNVRVRLTKKSLGSAMDAAGYVASPKLLSLKSN
ncbi:DUF2946 family protein [Undibacterium sp. Ji67W]|uniref:DUF2946 family protein n=1 Tax=Undibacterium sp. Ji67W TaxID=3413042 RepID=UPI003BF3B55E